MCCGCLASNGDLSLANGGGVGLGYNGTGNLSRDRNRACSSRPPHVGVAPSSGLNKLWGRPAEHMAPCPRGRHAGKVILLSSVPDTLNRAPRVYSVPMRAGRHCVGIPPLTLSRR